MVDSSGRRRRILTDPNAPAPRVAPSSSGPTPPPPWQTAPVSAPAPSLNVQAVSERIAKNDSALRERLAVALGRAHGLAVRLAELGETHVAGAAEDAAQSARRASEQYSRDHAALAARRDSGLSDLLTRTMQHIELLAPATAGLAPVAWNTAPGAPVLSRHQRIGWVPLTAGADADQLPIVHPLRVGSGWHVDGDPAAAADLILLTLMRLITQLHPRNLRIHVFDPRSGGRLGRLAGVRGVNAATFPQPHAVPGPFLEQVNEALRQAPANAERVALSGATDFVEMLEKDPSVDASLSVFVVLDFPAAITAELNAALQQLASLGAASGTLLLLQRSPGTPDPERVDASATAGLLASVRVQDGKVTTQLTSDLDVRADEAPASASIDAVVEGARRRVAADIGRTVELTELLADDIRTPWTRSSLHEVEAVLGVTGREPLPLALRTENPPHANILLGGMVGTGKSNALKDIIYSAAVRYAPQELELILLDFKAGIEFASFAGVGGVGWLPHVSVLGLESDQEYGVAVLQTVAAEIDHRSRLFRGAGGASSLVRYRELTGQPLPRLLIVIDEFHMLLDGDEDLAQDAAELLELVAKQGRAFGVHLLLASQALGGIRGLRTKADAIFAQFPIRVSLKNSIAESQAFLSMGNKAAADLTYRGEVVVNRNLGQQPELDNVRGLAAYVNQERFLAIQHDLWERQHDRRPQVFQGTAFAEIDQNRLTALGLATSRASGTTLWLGRGVTVDDAPVSLDVRDDADQLLALIGGDLGSERVAPSVLSGIVLSIAAQSSPGDEIVVLDAQGDDTVTLLEPAFARARVAGVTVRVVPAVEISPFLHEQAAPRLDQSGATNPCTIIGLGLQRVAGLDDVPPSEPTSEMSFGFGMSTAPTARQILADIARRGGLAQVRFIGWWGSAAAMEQTMGLAHNGVRAYVTVSAGLEDLKKIAGPLTKKLRGSPRVGFYDRASDAPLRSLVPLRLWADDDSSAVTHG